MVKALILYPANIKEKKESRYEVINLKKIEEYQNYVGGDIESLPIKGGYKNEKNVQKKLICYVNEEGLLKDLPNNPWAMILDYLGVTIPWNMGGLYGNIIVFTENKEGDDGNIDPYVISLVEKFKECEDEDIFLCDLGKTQKTRQSNKNSDEKTNNKSQPSVELTKEKEEEEEEGHKKSRKRKSTLSEKEEKSVTKKSKKHSKQDNI